MKKFQTDLCYSKFCRVKLSKSRSEMTLTKNATSAWVASEEILELLTEPMNPDEKAEIVLF